MTIELDAGTEDGEIPEGFTIPLANSEPNINAGPDPRLARRRHPCVSAAAAGRRRAGVRLKEKSQNFAHGAAPARPDVRDIAKINGAIAKRRENLRHVVTNFKLIAEELAQGT